MSDLIERLFDAAAKTANEESELLTESADELTRLRAELANANARDIHTCHADCSRVGCVNTRLRAEVEEGTMRLVACDVIAMADTPESALAARDMLPDYRSAALESVIRRVDECIALRAEVANLKIQLQIADSLLDGSGTSALDAEHWTPLHDRIEALRVDAEKMSSELIGLRARIALEKRMDSAFQSGYTTDYF